MPMTKAAVNSPDTIEKKDVKEMIISFKNEGKTGDELKNSITKEMLKLFTEGKIISEEAQEYLQTFERLYGNKGEEAIVEEKLTTETLEELKSRLFKKENFTLSKDWEKNLKAEGFKEKEHYYIKDGNFYCKSKKLMEFILWGREAAKKRTIDRYNLAILKSGDTKSITLSYTCTDEDLVKAFKESKSRKEWIKDPTVKQKFNNVNYPVGVVSPYDSGLNNTDRSYVPLWSPVNGEMFYIESNADEWTLIWDYDNDCAFPMCFPVKNS